MVPETVPVERPAAAAARGRWMPTTRWGRAACWFALAFLAWFFVVSPLTMALQGSTRSAPVPALVALSIAGFASGGAAGGLALVAIVRARERSPLVYACLVPFAFVLIFLAGELLFPH